MLLRLCNGIIRRLSKSQDASLCGKFLLYISKIFPSGERSGVNLRGDVNIDNVTPVDSKSETESPGFVLYQSFWKQQFYLYHPIQALMSENWPAVKKVPLPAEQTHVL